MIVMGASIVISLLVTGLSQAILPYQALSKEVVLQPTVSVSSKPSSLNFEYFENVLPTLGELKDNVCRQTPSGIGIPGFQPGLRKSDVTAMLGVPAVSSSGYWRRTRAVSYELIPNQVSLGFLFDRNSDRIRQTEIAFTPEVDSEVIEVTFNGMLGCRLNDSIKQGLQKVWRRQSNRYNFNLGSLEGVIERDKSDRVYIGIWEADLH
jgi:hypothetical protein